MGCIIDPYASTSSLSAVSTGGREDTLCAQESEFRVVLWHLSHVCVSKEISVCHIKNDERSKQQMKNICVATILYT